MVLILRPLPINQRCANRMAGFNVPRSPSFVRRTGGLWTSANPHVENSLQFTERVSTEYQARTI
jgi:hypothetical protein